MKRKGLHQICFLMIGSSTAWLVGGGVRAKLGGWTKHASDLVHVALHRLPQLELYQMGV